MLRRRFGAGVLLVLALVQPTVAARSESATVSTFAFHARWSFVVIAELSQVETAHLTVNEVGEPPYYCDFTATGIAFFCSQVEPGDWIATLTSDDPVTVKWSLRHR